MENKTIYEPVSRRLRKALKERNITQTKLADLAGVKRTTLNNYLNGVSEPNLETIAKLADVLNVNPLWLGGFNGPMELGEYTIIYASSDEAQAVDGSEDLRTIVRACMGNEAVAKAIAVLLGTKSE